MNGNESDGAEKTYGLEAFCDSDWGGSVSRTSTTSVIMLLCGVVIYSYSRNQKSVALSSCEAEVLAATSAASEAFLLKARWEFLTQQKCTIQIRTDSSSARQWLQRNGVGRLKHFDIRLLWLQKAIREGLVSIAPVGTKLNVADINTKKLTVARRKFLQYYLGVVLVDNKNEIQERIGEDEFHQNLLDEKMRLQVKRVNKGIHKSADVQRILMLALVTQLATVTEASSSLGLGRNAFFRTEFQTGWLAGMREMILLGLSANSVLVVATVAFFIIIPVASAEDQQEECLRSNEGSLEMNMPSWKWMLPAFITLIWTIGKLRKYQRMLEEFAVALQAMAHTVEVQDIRLRDHSEAIYDLRREGATQKYSSGWSESLYGDPQKLLDSTFPRLHGRSRRNDGVGQRVSCQQKKKILEVFCERGERST